MDSFHTASHNESGEGSKPASHASSKPRAVLDIRSHVSVFAVDPTQCVFMPCEQVVDRFVELPPKGAMTLLLICDALEAGCKEALDLLVCAEGYEADIERVMDGKDPLAWDILQDEGFTIIDAGELPSKLLDRASCSCLRMWKPSPIMPSVVEALRDAWLSSASSTDKSAGDALWILDAGSGKGRNAVFLAQELLKAPADETSPPIALTIVALEIRRILVQRAAKFFGREGLFWDAGAADAKPALSSSSSAAVSVFGSLEEFFDPPVKVKRAPPLSAYDGRGELIAELPAFPRKLSDYHGALFLRFSHNQGLVELARQLEATRQALASSSATSRPPFILAVECFHASSPHPKEREQKLEVGEVMALLVQGEQKAMHSSGVLAGAAAIELDATRWSVVSELVGNVEDGRPTLQGIYRFRFEADVA